MGLLPLSLKIFSSSHNTITNEGMSLLTRLTNLEILYLADYNGVAINRDIEGLTQLRGLCTISNDIDSECLGDLSRWTNLRHLYMVREYSFPNEKQDSSKFGDKLTGIRVAKSGSDFIKKARCYSNI
jgi:hypothetical protein